jgi:hypothetical protein
VLYICNYYLLPYDTVSLQTFGFFKRMRTDAFGVMQKAAGMACFKVVTWHMYEGDWEKHEAKQLGSMCNLLVIFI